MVHVDGPTNSEGDLGLFFIDTVREDVGTQDTMVTASVMESICVRLRKELPKADDVVLVSDNAPSYVKLTMPSIAYYMFKAYAL